MIEMLMLLAFGTALGVINVTADKLEGKPPPPPFIGEDGYIPGALKSPVRRTDRYTKRNTSRRESVPSIGSHEEGGEVLKNTAQNCATVGE